MKKIVDFIKRAEEIHSNKYDYSKVEYKNMQTPVCIICPKHGEFWQRPIVHLNGSGCKECSREKKMSFDFIEKAKKIHGDKYDYSKVEYKGSKHKICIICPIHGEFWQTPNMHLRGNGCPRCAKMTIIAKKTRTTELFIEKAIKVHGDKYDYSKVEYKHNKKEVCIICPKHGEFWQKPIYHLNGHGCQKCNKSNKLTKELFIEKAIKIHGDKYDYSKVEYKNNSTKVCIICPKHGEFWQTPNEHLLGHGCKKCSLEKKRKTKYSTNEIIKRFIKVHGDYFDYSKFSYKGIMKKSTIICPVHGEFEMTAHEHLKGHGCPRCNQSFLEKEVRQLLEANKIYFEEQKTFEWLKYKGRQYLDFYIPDYHIAIECQGIQHFKPTAFFTKNYDTAEEGFKEIVSRDNNKKKICEEMGIKIIYFSHKNIFIENKSNISTIFDNTNDLLKEILKYESESFRFY